MREHRKNLEGLVTSAKKRAFLSVEGKMQNDQRGPPNRGIEKILLCLHVCC